MAHLLIKNYYNLRFSTTPNTQFFPTVPHIYFSTKFRTRVKFIETIAKDDPDTCVIIIQNSTNHVATLPTGDNNYIEVPFTNEKPKYYQIHDIDSLASTQCCS